MAFYGEYARFGLTFQEAYHWISDIDLSPAQRRAVIWVTVHASEKARQTGEVPLDKYAVRVDDIGENTAYSNYLSSAACDDAGKSPVAQGYAYLKSLGSFARVTDV